MKRLRNARVRFVVIGVAGANYYARSAGLVFTTLDRDLFLPPEPGSPLRCWPLSTSFLSVGEDLQMGLTLR